MSETKKNKLNVGFDDIPIKLGDMLRMQAVGTPDASHYNVRFLGAMRGVSLLVTLPVSNGEGIWMRPNGQYVFRVLAGRHIYAFVAKALKARSHPYPYSHFAYPSSVEAVEVRNSPRVALRIASQASTAGGTKAPVTMLDLGMHGALLESMSALGKTGEQIKLEIPIALPETNKNLILDAEIRSATQGSPTHYGVFFHPLSDGDALLLHFFVYYMIAEGTAGAV